MHKNFCIYNGIYSECGARPRLWHIQTECGHAEKSKLRNECLYYCFDGRCDNYNAQKEAKAKYYQKGN